MKAKFFFSLLAVLFLSTATYANTPETIVLSNIEQTEEGCVKEFLYCDKNTNAPLNKTTYRYDAEGRIMDKATYKWDSVKGWTGIQKYAYEYDANNLPVPSIVKWNKKANNWDNTGK
ncbi:hypothetical protein M2451_002811 [Dysgonomonas sp. PFB1-18]|uniref:DUF3836 domain-containing protein n=1 Tax=unclassified Dysgonomonas TaxID=2630389 RepID=UPI002474A79A|nr:MULTISPECIES: DUF3836 domain-containing protein [unclassified Dysgonomonas]MDH6309303.1 hypothetical protein [Dysgonomonas sp. PF1-14]MDH6339832.1 hypothetical protein [Dysgonomonas sp. PF1-16]MDH6381480.1 hypothetical protein [Dysgonomonas sp. PFB1-18]MDH6398695.1 hypothetical protein [Dysgonomonas sp. PF1-23]